MERASSQKVQKFIILYNFGLGTHINKAIIQIWIIPLCCMLLYHKQWGCISPLDQYLVKQFDKINAIQHLFHLHEKLLFSSSFDHQLGSLQGLKKYFLVPKETHQKIGCQTDLTAQHSYHPSSSIDELCRNLNGPTNSHLGSMSNEQQIALLFLMQW